MTIRLPLVCLLALAGPAHAFDCSKASTKAEKAICADPAARAADEDLGKAFAAAVAQMSPSDKAGAAAAQARWVGERDRNCPHLSGAKLSICLVQESLHRRDFLAAEPEAGPGAPGRLAPYFRYEKVASHWDAVDFQLLKFPAPATPAERAFNAAVERVLGHLAKPLKDDSDESPLEFVRSMRLAYASPRLISAEIAGYDDSIVSYHPHPFFADTNILVEEGREAKFADLVDAKAAEKLAALCLGSVRTQANEMYSRNIDLPAELIAAKNIAEAMAKLEAGSFGADSAVVSYDPYVTGGYGATPYECVIPYATLKPLAKPGFPLP